MSIEGENRELLFQELYNMVGYHLAKYGQMPSLSFDDKNPKSSDPTKHVEYDENEEKIVIHTGRFKMKRDDILEKLRGFECEIDIDGQTENVKFGFTNASQGNNSIAVGALEGFLTCVDVQLISQERQEKYYAKKKTPIVDRNQEDGNEELGNLFNKGPNKGPEAKNSSVQNIMNKYGGPSVPQQTGPQPNGGQQPKEDIWLTEDIPYNFSLQEEGIDQLLGVKPDDGQDYQVQDVTDAVKRHAKSWGSRPFKESNLRIAAQHGNRVIRQPRINNNYNNNQNVMNPNNNMLYPNMMNPNNNMLYPNMVNQNQGGGMYGMVNQNQGVGMYGMMNQGQGYGGLNNQNYQNQYQNNQNQQNYGWNANNYNNNPQNPNGNFYNNQPGFAVNGNPNYNMNQGLGQNQGGYGFGNNNFGS